MKYLPSKRTAKAAAAGVVSLAAYLIGVIPAEGGMGDVSTVQWLGAVVFLGGAYGITYRIPNGTQPTALAALDDPEVDPEPEPDPTIEEPTDPAPSRPFGEGH